MEILIQGNTYMRYVSLVIYTIICAHASLINGINPTFGKTHFIIGMEDPIQQMLFNTVPTAAPKVFSHTNANAYFAPDDNLEDILCQYIAREHEAIDIAVYSFTNKRIAQALIDAHKRGVTIRIVTDQYGIRDRFSKLQLLQENNIPIFVYDPMYRGKSAATLNDAMHNKFLILKKNYGELPCVWTGSFNFTKSATKSNQENVLTTQEDAIVQKYVAQFNRLLQRCKKIIAQ